jgi:hypothetical protein
VEEKRSTKIKRNVLTVSWVLRKIPSSKHATGKEKRKKIKRKAKVETEPEREGVNFIYSLLLLSCIFLFFCLSLRYSLVLIYKQNNSFSLALQSVPLRGYSYIKVKQELEVKNNT